MEIEVKPIDIDDRLCYLNDISANQKDNTKKFSWVAFIAGIIGGFLLGLGMGEKVRKQKEQKKAN